MSNHLSVRRILHSGVLALVLWSLIVSPVAAVTTFPAAVVTEPASLAGPDIAAAVDWSHPDGDANGSGAVAGATGPTGFVEKRWNTSLPQAEGLGSPVLWNGTLFALSRQSGYAANLSAVDAETGTVEWEIPVSSPDSVAVKNGYVVLSEEGHPFVYSAADGSLLWKNESMSAGGRIAIGDSYAYGAVRNDGIRITAFNPATGSIAWEREHPFADLAGPIIEASVGGGQYVYYTKGSSSPYTLYKVNAATGVEQWNRSLGDDSVRTVAISGGQLFVGGGHGVSVYDAATGSELWNHTEGSGSVPDLAVSGDRLYVGYPHDDSNEDPEDEIEYNTGTVYTLLAFDTTTQQKLWTYYAPGVPWQLRVAGDSVYGAYEGYGEREGVFGVDADTGTQQFQYETPTQVHGPVISDGRAYFTFTGPNGASPAQLYAIGDGANFTLSSPQVTPTTLEVGDELHANATLTNHGPVAGNYNLSLRFDGVEVATQSGTVAGNTSTDIEFTYTIRTGGSYEVAIDGTHPNNAFAAYPDATVHRDTVENGFTYPIAAPTPTAVTVQSEFGPGDWPTLQFDSGRSGYNPTADALTGNVTLDWNDSSSREYGPAVVYNGTAFVTNGSAMLAYDAATGERQWVTAHDTSAYGWFPSSSPVLSDGRVFASTDEYLLGYNVSTGALETTTEGASPGDDAFAPVAGGNLVFFALDSDPLSGEPSGVDGRLYATTLDGQELWNQPLDGWPVGPVAYADGRVYTQHVSTISAFEATTGEPLWNASTAQYQNTMTVVGDRVYVSDNSDPSRIRALDTATGATVWNVNFSTIAEEPSRSPSETLATDGSTLYVGYDDDTLFALNATDGSVRWNASLAPDERIEDVQLVDNVLYLTANDTLRAVSATDGQLYWTYAFSEPINGLALSDDRILVSTAGGIEVLHAGVHYSNLAVSAASIQRNETATVTATVSNPQSAVRNYTANLYVNGAVVATETGQLAPGASTAVSFTHRFPSPMDYTVQVGNHQSQVADSPLTVSAGPQPTGTWASLRGNPQGTGVGTTTPPAGNVSVLWATGTDASHYDFVSPVVHDGIAYFSGVNVDGYSGGLAAYSAATGEEYWSIGEYLYSTPTVHNGTVFASVESSSGDYVVYAVEAGEEENQLWTEYLGDNTGGQGSLTVANGTVYVPTDSDNTLYALDEADGSEKWATVVSDSISVTPAVADGQVYLADDDGYVYALSTATGATVWQTPSLGFDATSPAIHDGVVYLTVDNELYALSTADGSVVWNTTVPNSPESSAVAVSDGLVLVGTDGGFYAYAAETGDEQWNYTAGAPDFRPPAVANGVVYVVDQYEALVALDVSTGDLLFRSTGFEPEETPAVVDNYVYLYGYVDDYSLVALTGPTTTGPAPSLQVSGSGAFGDVSVGSSSTETLTLMNDGSADLSITNITTTGADAAAFTAAVGTLPTVLVPGESTTIDVTFAPPTVGIQSAALRVASNASSEPQIDTPLSGTGVGDLTVNPLTIDFGSAAVGSTVTETVVITNQRSTTVTVGGETLTGASASLFSTTNSAPFSIAPGSSHTVTVSFTPTSATPATATLNMSTDDAGVPFLEVTLEGEGATPEIDVQPQSIDFGSVNVGDTTSKTVTVTNVGAATLSVSGVDVSGAGISVANTGGFTLAPLASKDLTLTFAPTVEGTVTGQVNVSSDDSDESVVTVSTTGTATQATQSGGGRQNPPPSQSGGGSQSPPASQSGSGSQIPPPEPVIEVTTAGENVSVSVTNTQSGGTLELPLTNSSVNGDGPDGDLVFDQLDINTSDEVDFTMTVSVADTSSGTESLAVGGNGTAAFAFLTVSHNIPDDTVSEVSFTFRVSKAYLAANALSASDVVLYRNPDGTTTWNELPTTVVRETPAHYVLKAVSPGFSTFAATSFLPQLSVGDAAASTSSTAVDTPVSIKAQVTNDGRATGNLTVEFAVDDTIVSTRTVTVAERSSSTVSFSHQFESAGTYELSVNGQSAGSVTVEAADTEASTTATATATVPESRTATTTDSPGFGIGAALIALAAAALLARRQ